MTKPVLFIQSIQQKDNHTFTINWHDGKVADYSLAELQKACPCAGCWDEGKSERLIDQSKIPSHLSAVKISSVGRYAIRIQFSSGCSNGIYGFDYLYEKGAK